MHAGGGARVYDWNSSTRYANFNKDSNLYFNIGFS